MSSQSELNNTIWLDFPASLKYLNVLGSCITALLTHVKRLPDPETTAYNIQLAVHEIYTNCALHAYENKPEAGRISISLLIDPDERFLKINLIDTGIPFNERLAVDPDLNEIHIHGYGLFIARQLLDTVSYQRLDNKNSWLLIKHFLSA